MTDKAREVFQTALEFFGDEEEQIEKAQVGPQRRYWGMLTM